MTACFWIEPSGRDRVSLRRYASDSVCPSSGWIHNAQTLIDVVPTQYDERQLIVTSRLYPEPPHDDPRWPATCGCGYTFEDADEWQVFTQTVYRRADTGAEDTLNAMPPGAMWDAWWMPERMKGHDGRCVVVRCPDGHDWMIDSESSNCTRKGEDHDCWCRHGDPPNLTVDKIPEPGRSTCAAGGGSIQTKNWHGFLRDGRLVPA